MNINFLKSIRGKQMLGALVMASLVTPAIIYADASNPIYTQQKAKAKVHKKAHKRIARAKPKAQAVAVDQPVYTAPEPVYTPPPVEAPPPAPVYSAPAEVSAAPSAPVAVAKAAGGKGVLVAILAAAAVAGGIALASGSNNPTSP